MVNDEWRAVGGGSEGNAFHVIKGITSCLEAIWCRKLNFQTRHHTSCDIRKNYVIGKEPALFRVCELRRFWHVTHNLSLALATARGRIHSGNFKPRVHLRAHLLTTQPDDARVQQLLRHPSIFDPQI